MSTKQRNQAVCLLSFIDADPVVMPVKMDPVLATACVWEYL